VQHLIWRVLNLALQALSLIIILDVILSYLPLSNSVSRYNPFVVIIRRISRTVTAPIRKVFPPQRMGDAYMDFSPIIVIVAIMVIQKFLASFLLHH
jgi:uncharacterized protein YggT (Ycf19 family)